MADGGSQQETGRATGGAGALNLVKLSVGTGSVEDLAAWQSSRAAERRHRGASPCPVHVTRMWPRREGELLAGGSIYWVVKGLLCVRQRIVALEEAPDAEGRRRCAIVLDPKLIRTEPRPCRPFQGWRYLPAGEAPPDIPGGAAAAGALPLELERALSTLGLGRR